MGMGMGMEGTMWGGRPWKEGGATTTAGVGKGAGAKVVTATAVGAEGKGEVGMVGGGMPTKLGRGNSEK